MAKVESSVAVTLKNRKTGYCDTISLSQTAVSKADPHGETVIGAKLMRWSSEAGESELSIVIPDDVVDTMVAEEFAAACAMLPKYYAANGEEIEAEKDVELEHVNALFDFLGIELDLESVSFDVQLDDDEFSGVTAAAAVRAAVFIESGRSLQVGFEFIVDVFLKTPELTKYFVEYNSADDLSNMSKAAGRGLAYVSMVVEEAEGGVAAAYRQRNAFKPKHVHWMTNKSCQNRFIKMANKQGITAKFSKKMFETSGTRAQDFPTGYQESTASQRFELECSIAVSGERKRKRDAGN